MITRDTLYAALVWALVILFAAPAGAQTVNRVLLLNSYNRDLAWTSDVTDGVEETLGSQDIPIKLSIEFMDTKNYYNSEYLNILIQEYKLKYSHIQFDAIIASDDNAANFVLQQRENIFGNAPLVFCGVNNFNFPMRADFSNATGVLEFSDMKSTIESAIRLQPDLKRIYIVNDETTSGKFNRSRITKVLPEFEDIEFAWIESMSMSEVKNTLANLPGGSAVLLGSFNRDRLGVFYTYLETLGILSAASSAPIYGLWDFLLGKGIVGGMLMSGYHQGRIAADMATEIIKGRKAEAIPIIIEQANQYMFDNAVMERYGIDTGRVPDGSVVINIPESISDKYAHAVWSFFGVVVFLTTCILILLVNIRARRSAEVDLEELSRYQEELIEIRTDELTQRSRELELANYELKKLDELKTAVLNTVSHDLRTPLTAVLGFCKIIDRDFRRSFVPLAETDEALEKKSERITNNLAIIEKEGGRLTRLINDFLDLSKIESGDIAWNDVSVDPVTLFTHAHPILEGYFMDSQVAFDLVLDEPLPKIVADPDRLLQVLNNLVGNAGKFTYQGKVTLTATTTEGGWLKVTVSDTGVGISKPHLERIFDNFYQVDQESTSRKVISRGSGMGLAISKRIVEHYGGTISASSKPDQGSSFTFTIPSISV